MPPQENQQSPQPGGGLVANSHAKIKHHFSDRTRAIITIVIILIVGGGIAWGLATSKSNHPTAASTDNTNSEIVPPTTSDNSASPLPKPQTLGGVTYYDQVKPVGDLHFFKSLKVFGDKNTLKYMDLKYFEIGQTADGSKVVVFSFSQGIGNAYIFALGQANGQYQLLPQNDQNTDTSTYESSLASNVTVDKKTKLTTPDWPQLTNLSGLSLQGYDKQFPPAFGWLMPKGLKTIQSFGTQLKTTPTKITSKGDIDFYRVVADDQPTFQVDEIYGTYKKLFSLNYSLTGELADLQNTTTNKKPIISWSDGATSKKVDYFTAGQGCSLGGGFVVAKNIDSTMLTQSGTLPSGLPVYQLPVSNALVQKIYKDDYLVNKSMAPKGYRNLTVQQMNDVHAYFLAQNGFGDWVLYQRSDIFIRGGCAKPVDYLYPTSPTKVSVVVGAQIKKAAPRYQSTGWQNVLALPSGELSYRGRDYGSLYWEGYGIGRYPDINSGSIVKSSQIVSTVRTQLKQQGLNQKEISDFMDYWQGKLNTSQPYARISWLGTAQLNQLAPLKVNPQPQTVIRVFLDFQPLDKPYQLAKQHFVAPARNGFTLVEWGGLARQGL